VSDVLSVPRPILLIEDNPADLDLALRAFKRRHLLNPVKIVRDGQEALDLLPAWEAGEPLPIVALLDLNLPKVCGLEVLRQFKACKAVCGMPVVVLTTSDEDRDIKAAYELGVNSYIVKPVDFESFANVAAQIDLYWCVLNKPVPSSS
jgi:CheY-like chemotaxis protein